MAKIERFIKTAGVYFFGNAITKLLSFLLLPLYTNKILPDEFGEYGLVLSVTNLIIPLVFFQIWDSVFRYSFDYKKNDNKFKVISNGFLIMIFGVIIFSVGYWILAPELQFDYKILIYLYSISTGFQYYYTVIARSLYKNLLFVLSGCINSGVMLVLNVILIVFFDRGIDALYFSAIIGILIQIIMIEINVKPIRRFRRNCIEIKFMKELVFFSAPISISTMSHWLLNGLTQLVISLQIGSFANGLFTVVNKFSSMLVLLVGIFQFAWNEMAYMLSNDSNKNDYYSRSINEILKISILGSSIFILLVKLIFPYYIGSQYQTAIHLIPIVIIGTMANAYSGFLGTIFLANKKSKSLFATTMVSSVSNVIGLYLLIPRWGLFGAVTSLCIAFIIGTVARTLLLAKKEKIGARISSYFPLLQLGISTFIFYYVKNIYLLSLFLVINIVISIIWLKPLIIILLDVIKAKGKKIVHQTK